jgi:hypothetical protein
MKDDTSIPRYFARGLAVLLWIAGSAYLVRNELTMPSPDLVVIFTMPLIWAAVISLPILAHHAWKQSQWTACALLSIAAIVGTCFTLSGTVSRQSEARDGKVAAAQAQNFTRSELLAELDRAKQRYEDANKYADIARGDRKCGQQCRDWELRAKEVKAHIDQLTRDIAAIGADKPVASGEKRVAAAISALPFIAASRETVEANVALFLPFLFGVFLEVAALACAFYGWQPMSVNTAATTAKSLPEQEKSLGTDVAPIGQSVGTSTSDNGQSDFDANGEEVDPRWFGDGPKGPKPGRRKPKSKKREQRLDQVTSFMDKYVERHGHEPRFKTIKGQFRMSNGTAHRYLQAAKEKRALTN